MNWRHFPMMTAICWFSNILQRLTVSQIINQFGSFLLSDCRSARAGCTQSFLLNCSCQVDLKHILCALDFSCQEVVKASTLTQKDHEAGLALVLMTAHGEIWNRNRMIIAFFMIKHEYNSMRKTRLKALTDLPRLRGPVEGIGSESFWAISILALF